MIVVPVSHISYLRFEQKYCIKNQGLVLQKVLYVVEEVSQKVLQHWICISLLQEVLLHNLCIEDLQKVSQLCTSPLQGVL